MQKTILAAWKRAAIFMRLLLYAKVGQTAGNWLVFDTSAP